MRTLTPEQQLAISRRQGSLLLAAGAGSGKTSVLVERFVRAVLDDGVAPGRILAITFTERAAGELRARVRARFLELGEREAARDTEAAHISTFHGFCARLLRTHPLLAGLDPEFTILEESLSGRLRLRAFRAAVSDFLAREGDAAVELLAAYGIDRLRGMVLGAHSELRSRGHSLPRLPVPRPRGEPALARRVLLERLEELEPELLAAHDARAGKRLAEALAALAAARSLPDGVPSLGELSALKLRGAASGALASPACEAYRTALARFTEACADAHAARAVGLLDGLLQGFAEHYAQLKRARGALDFDDLELYARALLERETDVRANWSQRMELLMVDEFQDTNRRQLALLELLERGNLFTVGDELQSIYGFRHADVEIFRARQRALAAQESSLQLARNFRSRPPLIEVVNGVFAARFGERYTPLVAGREADPEASAGTPSIELLLSDKQGWGAEDGAEGERLGAEAGVNGGEGEDTLATGHGNRWAPPANWREAEARLLAQRVAELVGEGRTRAGEVVVLLRALGDLPVYERALQQCGLSTLASVGSFYSQQQVGDLLSYLRTLANPLDELALYSTLASPLVGLSADALVLLARAARAAGTGLWAAAIAVDPALRARLGEHNSEALDDFLARLITERAVAPGYGVAELLRRVLTATAYETHVLRLGQAERRLANIHKLLRLARRYEAQEGRDLRGFLDHVSHQQDFMEGSEPQAPVADGEPDAVRLMSIHAAKGLEFPVVCLADLGRTGNLGLPDLLLDEQRIGLRLVGLEGSESLPALQFEQLSEERRRAEAEEEERIVYVAMTRARERLLLSGTVDFERWPEIRPGAAPIAWLGRALVADLPVLLNSPGEPVRDLPTLRLWLSTPANVGQVLREQALIGAVAQASSAIAQVRPTVARSPEPSEREVGVSEHGPGPLLDPAISLSYTALSELERCGYRYYLERVLGFPEGRAAVRSEQGGHALEGRVRGTIVHRLLESLDFVRPIPPTVEDVAAVASQLGVTVSVGEREEIAELVSKASATALAERLGTAPRVRRELPFAFTLGAEQRLITGVLDAVVHDLAGDILIVDYKSDRVAPDQDLEALVEREYGLQRLIYALAALHDGAQRVEIVHWFLQRPADWVTASFQASERQLLEERLNARIERARTIGFTVSEAPHRGLCLTCPGRSGMCSWGEAETLREIPGAVGVAVGESN
jgi:ATP-dependent helicase/nuclease subunit A